jgi:small conductance mechanosensitive channel
MERNDNMLKSHILANHIKVFLLLSMLCASSAQAQFDLNSNPVGRSNVGPSELAFRLTPLTQQQLTATAEHWINLLQQHLEATADAQVLLSTATATEKTQLLEKLNEQNEQQILLIDKVKLVLTELQKKGGDTKDYQSYIDAVSAPKVDAKDTSALLSAAKGWLLSPEGGVRWAINIGLFLVTLLAFKILAGIFASITKKSVSRLKQASDLLKNFFVNLVRNLTKAIGFMTALSMLEINVAPLVAALGATGFIVGFALQGTLSNFASGLMILIYRPYDIGNVVNVAGTTGKVSSMTLVSTTLTLPDNQRVVIPNNAIWGSTITNITGNETRRVDLIFGIGYNDDIAQAEKVLRRILEDHPLVLKDPEPIIKVHELADSSVNFVVRPWAKTEDYFSVYWDVTRSVKERFDEEEISIPFPQQDIHLHTVRNPA